MSLSFSMYVSTVIIVVEQLKIESVSPRKG